MQEDANAAYLREQAARCRRLADAIPNEDDSATLRRVADDFEAQAAAIDGAKAPQVNGTPQMPPQS